MTGDLKVPPAGDPTSREIPVHEAGASLDAETLERPPHGVPGASGHRMEHLHPGPITMVPFRAHYYSLVLNRTGTGTFTIDGTTYPTRARTVYFTNPGHVKGFTHLEPRTGILLTFSEAFLKEHAHSDPFRELPFLLAETAPPFYADAETFGRLDRLAEQIVEEFARPSPVRGRIVGSLLMATLLRFRDAFWGAYSPAEEGDRGSAIVVAFRCNLEARLQALVAGAAGPPTVADLADEQALHPTYLGTVVKAKTGRTVGEWISRRLAAEAGARLAASQQSVKEVAFTLGFSEATHFSRFFKRETGLTPSAFRGSRTPANRMPPRDELETRRLTAG